MPDPDQTSPEQRFREFRDHADAGALAAVFDAVAAELLLVAAHLAPPGVEAEDLVQVTFVDAIANAARWDPSRPLVPWLVGLLANHARNERRRLARVVDERRLVRGGEAQPDDAAAAEEAAALVRGAIASLPRPYRQVLSLRVVHGLTPKQIAHALDCPVATVKTRLQRGTQALKAVLPAGIAASLAVLVGAGRGLAQVREVVLAAAARATPVAVGAAASAGALGGGVIGGALLMKKVAVAAVAGALALVMWDWWRDPGVDAPAGTGGGGPVATRAETAGRAADAGAAGTAATPAEREAVMATPTLPDATGGIELEFVWQHDGSPARGLRVSAKAAGDPDAEFDRVCDGAGRLVVSDLQPGELQLFGRKLWHRVEVRPGEVTRERVVVAASVRMRGIVVDPAGNAVAGADVLVQYFPDSSDDTPRLLAVSGADGRFDGATDVGGYVWAARDGYAPSRCRLEQRDGELELRLQLGHAAGVVRGVVRGANGEPAAGARLTFVDLNDAAVCGAPTVVHADAQGAFAVGRLVAGEHLVVAQAAGHAATPTPLTVAAGRDEVLSIRLQRGARVHGRVTDGAGNAVRARVEARPHWAGSAGGVWVEARRPLYLLCLVRADVDADGGYVLEHVPAGLVDVHANPFGGSLSVQAEVELFDAAPHRRDFVVRPGGVIVGRLVDAEGRALRGWQVHASPEGGGTGATAQSDREGAFELRGLDAPTYTVTARRTGAALRMPWAQASGVRPGHGRVELRIEHRPDDGAWLTGSVRARGGDVATGAVLWLHRDGESRTWSVELSPRDDGTFRVGPVPPASYRLRVKIGSEGIVDLGARDLRPRGVERVGTLAAPAAGTLTLRLQAVDGRTFEPDELRVWDRVGNAERAFERGDDGGYHSRPLPAGRYQLWAWGRGFALVRQEVVVIGERDSAITVLVEPATAVRFDVKGAGVDTNRVELTLHTAAGERVAGRSIAIARGEGAVTLGLKPGHYVLAANAGQSRVEQAFEVGRGGGQRVAVSLPIR